MSQKMSGKQAVLEMLKAEGIEYIFGNPGTSEGPLVDMLGEYSDTGRENLAGTNIATPLACPSFNVDAALAFTKVSSTATSSGL